MPFTPKPEDLRDPGKSEVTMIGEEIATDCDGIECGTAVAGDDGQPTSYIRHDRHLVVYGYNPLASPRYFAVPR
jgi:hypothetical protein